MLRFASTRPRRLAVGLVLTGSLVGCSLTMSFDGLTGGGGSDGGLNDVTVVDDSSQGEDTGSAGPTGDGSTEGMVNPVDATTADSGGTMHLDGGSQPDSGPGHDSGGGVEGGRDASTTPESGVDAAPPPYCSTVSPTPLYCNDFDQGALDPAWDQTTAVGGTATVVGGEWVSPPSSWQVAVNAGANESTVDIAGYKSFPAKQGASGTCNLQLQLRVDTADTSSAADGILTSIQLWNGSDAWDLELELSYDTASTFAVALTEESDYATHPSGATITKGTWVSVGMTLVLPAGAGGATTATLSLDGTKVLTTTVHVLSGGAALPSPIPEILVGATYATSATSGWSVRYDNVTFDIQ
jgi:hypothetical protein